VNEQGWRERLEGVKKKRKLTMALKRQHFVFPLTNGHVSKGG